MQQSVRHLVLQSGYSANDRKHVAAGQVHTTRVRAVECCITV